MNSFNGKLRDEGLRKTLLATLRHACNTVEEWQEDFNWRGPPSAWATGHRWNFCRERQGTRWRPNARNLTPRLRAKLEGPWGSGQRIPRLRV
ncbi:hypothetical protein [Phaeobacter sp. S60]|uniref:hypothetical protein n=1 Tax=Phaeobacter sp. S60 TaxID=1569353 RepID=UPI00350FBCE7